MLGLFQSTIKDFKKFIKVVKDELNHHIGKYAILSEQEGRNQNAYLIEILPNFIGRYKCYDADGQFRCFITKSVDFISLFTGEHKLIFLGKI